VNRLIAIIYALYVALYVTGCVIGTGTVNVYSPRGSATVDKTVSTDATLDIPLIP
jgi:hypothetical protein